MNKTNKEDNMKTIIFDGTPRKILFGVPSNDFKQWVLEKITWKEYFLYKFGLK